LSRLDRPLSRWRKRHPPQMASWVIPAGSPGWAAGGVGASARVQEENGFVFSALRCGRRRRHPQVVRVRPGRIRERAGIPSRNPFGVTSRPSGLPAASGSSPHAHCPRPNRGTWNVSSFTAGDSSSTPRVRAKTVRVERNFPPVGRPRNGCSPTDRPSRPTTCFEKTPATCFPPPHWWRALGSSSSFQPVRARPARGRSLHLHGSSSFARVEA